MVNRSCRCCLPFRALFIALALVGVAGTSSKMDFLPLGHVRTDPILARSCLSDHVHTFYGANVSLRPETTVSDLRAAKGNSGNVKENLSLYWHPSIYKLDPVSGIYTLVKPWFTTAYYIWTTNKTEAFPDGFQMIAKQMTGPKTKWKFECNGPEDGIPFHAHPESGMNSSARNFPNKSCSELEMRIAFPSCYDGNATSPDGMAHVAYAEDAGAFDDRCPPSHPRKIPEIQLYIRIQDYDGGYHVFSDGSDMLHADYMSGWNSTELQKVLDTCFNSGEAAMPDKWCENQLTFRDAPKTYDPLKNNDHLIYKKLTKLQPPALDTQGTVSPEEVNNTRVLHRGGCTGTLLPAVPPPAVNTTPGPCSVHSCSSGCLFQGTCYTKHPNTQEAITQQMCNQYDGTLWCGSASKEADSMVPALSDSMVTPSFLELSGARKGPWPVKTAESTPSVSRHRSKGFLAASQARSWSEASPSSVSSLMQTHVQVSSLDASENGMEMPQEEGGEIQNNPTFAHEGQGSSHEL